MNVAIIVLYVLLCLLGAFGIGLCFVILRQAYEIKLLRLDLKRLQDDVFILGFHFCNSPGSAPVEDK